VVTILRCDVVGSTALGETVDPEAFRALLARYFERLKAILERHGGTVEKFIGDAVMSVFGVPLAHEDDALRACRAAVEIRDALPGLGIEGRIGLMTGEVVSGTEERLATGDAVNVAARLEQAADPGEILIGKPTVELVREFVELDVLEPLALKGKAEPLEAFRLKSVHEPRSRPAVTPFVGRREEVAAIRKAWEHALQERHCELVTIAGEAGIGKSRLVAEALDSLRGARVVHGRCLPYGEGITYWPVVEVIKQLGALPSDRGAAAAIRSLLGESDVGTSPEEIAWAFRKLLEESGPLVCVFDDIQWAEETFLDLLEHVALLSSGSPLLLLCMARLELLERRPSWPLTVRLEPLARDEVETLVGEQVSDDLREQIVRGGGGNPLFVGEMLAIADEARGEIEVPPTLRAVLSARLDQLDPSERRVLEAGSVEGEVFHRGAVQALAGVEGQVTPRLAALVRHGLLHVDRPQLAGEDGFRFRHVLIRDAAYNGLSKSARADLHERLASWLEEREIDLVELDEILGYHFERAVQYREELGELDEATRSIARRAAHHLALAGRRGALRGDTPAAVSLLSRAVALLDEDDPQRPMILPALGEVLHLAGELEQSERVLTAAVEAASGSGELGVELLARIQLVELQMFIDPEGRAEEALAEAARAVPVFLRLGDARALAKAWHLRMTAEIMRAGWAAVADTARKAVDYSQQAGDTSLANQARGWLSCSYYYGPLPAKQGIACCMKLLADVGEQSPIGCAVILGKLGGLRAMRGDFERARADVERAREISAELGLAIYLATQEFWGVERLAGDLEQAEWRLRQACEALEKMGEKSYLSTLAAQESRVLYTLGHYDDAEHFASLSQKAAASDDVISQALWRSARAQLLARRDRPFEAEQLVREAVEIIDRTDMLDEQASTRLHLAEVLKLAGQVPDSAAALEDALTLYKRKGNLVMAAQARTLLDMSGVSTGVLS